jgi:hypothetical protein
MSLDLCGNIAVFYLARGADEDSPSKFARFIHSYLKYDSSVPHSLNIIFKGFSNISQLRDAERHFSAVEHTAFYLDDIGFDLGAYRTAALQTEERYLCFLGTSSWINAEGWLLKLGTYLCRPEVGLVGASGNYESAVGGLGDFPNPHLRTTGFMIRREDFLNAFKHRDIHDKSAAYSLEHGDDSLTVQSVKNGLQTLVIGRNGRGYEPYFWPISDTFRQGNQDNLLIRDGQSESYEQADRHEKSRLFALSWGTGELLPALRSSSITR